MRERKVREDRVAMGSAKRKIRAPHAFDGDKVAGERLLWHAACIASDVARHTSRDADETMVAIMRLVGHLCEIGEED